MQNENGFALLRQTYRTPVNVFRGQKTLSPTPLVPVVVPLHPMGMANGLMDLLTFLQTLFCGMAP